MYPQTTPQPTNVPQSDASQGVSPAAESFQPPAVTESNDRQQVIDKLKNATNVLVTVGSNSTVDELSSALGLTLLLDKLGKHATTVFSGEIPRAIEFLDPEATFEDNVDSLRDFIIALDKEKADKLRYKVEEDVVRIFITPYKTKISEKDLNFSQGDFNVDVIVALGVVARDDLDKAITAHGRILHDATVVTVNVGAQTSTLGSINWNEQKASSIAEMLVDVGSSFGDNLLDSQISTAYLTGIVASTNRFSNEKTSPKVMTLAAQLMAAGANQQLIASNLRQDGVLSENVRKPGEDHAKESEVVVDHKDSSSNKKPEVADEDKKTAKDSKKPKLDLDDELDSPNKDETPKPPDFPPKANDEVQKASEVASIDLPDDLKKQLEPTEDDTKVVEPPISDLKIDTAASSEPTVPPEPVEASDDQPSFNATMAQVAADKAAPTLEDGSQPLPPLPSLNSAPSTQPSQPNFSVPTSSLQDDQQEELDGKDNALEEARRAVESAAEAQPFNPANNPIESIGAQPLPSLNHDPLASPGIDEALQPSVTTSLEPLPSVEVPSQDLSSEPAVDSLEGVSSALPPPPAPDKSFLEGGLDEPDTSPMDSFMSAHAKPTIEPEQESTEIGSASVEPQNSTPDFSGGLPPLPPTPPIAPGDPGLPPPPPLPGQELVQPPVDGGLTPQVQPAFMQDLPASQNQWTQAGDEVAAKKAAEEQNRQAKMDQMTSQYDSAVDKNLEIQGLPPINSDINSPPPAS